MRIKFNKTPEQVELVKAMASSNKIESAEAQEAFAAFIAPVVQEVLEQAGTASLIYEDMTYDEDDSPSIPLDLYHGETDGHISVWSQTVGGGLPTNFVAGMQEIKVSTYSLNSAISFEKRNIRRSRLDVVARGLERMANEVLVKQERNAWAVILKVLADAETQGQKHILRATAADNFQLDDVNRLFTLIRRLNAAYTGGTPVLTQSRGLTDLFVSPEIMQEVRSFVYQPMNTRPGYEGTDEDTSVGIALPDEMRSNIYRNAGAGEVFGVTLHELLELGVDRKYNDLFKFFADSTSYAGGVFNDATEEIVVGIDMARRSYIRPVATYEETGGTLQVLPDDQFVARSRKVGFYGELNEGRVCLDQKSTIGLIV
jgi:hypothetical protein